MCTCNLLLQDRGEQVYNAAVKNKEKLEADLRSQEHKMQQEEEEHNLKMRVSYMLRFRYSAT